MAIDKRRLNKDKGETMKVGIEVKETGKGS